MDDLIKQVELEIIRNEVLSSFEKFINYFFPRVYGFDFKWNWHHYLMCEYVDKIVSGEEQYLVVNIPPRYTKTEIWSIFFPAYGFALQAKSKFINVSYSEPLVLRNSSYVQKIINHSEFQELFPDTEIGKKAAKEWENKSCGGFKAVSTGGGITGFGAGLIDGDSFGGAIIVDDPLKPQDKDSEAKRPACIEYFKNTLLSRTNNKNVPIIIVMQRLHEDDLAGWVLSDKCPLPFKLLKIPVMSDDGTPLWEEKHNADDIRLLKKTMGIEFSGQYEQEPSPAEGGLFKDKYWQYYDLAPNFEYIIATVDTAEGKTQEADYTVLQAWGKYLNRAYFIDEIKVKANPEELEILADAFCLKNKVRMRFVEDYNLGTGLISYWKRKGIPVKGIKQSKSKTERANAVLQYIIVGYVYLNKNYEGLSDLLKELRNFPNAKHDDSVDCVTLAIKVLLESEGFMLYDEFNPVRHILQKSYIPSLPLFISFNCENQGAYIFGQITNVGQLIIFDSGVADDMKKEEIIRKCQTNQLINYNASQNNFRLIAYEKNKLGSNPFDWAYTLKDKFVTMPRIHEINKFKNDIIDLTAKLFTESVFNPESGEREEKIIIHPRNEQLIAALEGGLTYELNERDAERPDKKIIDKYPYTNLVNAFHCFIYEVYLAQRFNQIKAQKKEIKLKAHYNK